MKNTNGNNKEHFEKLLLASKQNDSKFDVLRYELSIEHRNMCDEFEELQKASSSPKIVSKSQEAIETDYSKMTKEDVEKLCPIEQLAANAIQSKDSEFENQNLFDDDMPEENLNKLETIEEILAQF